MVDIIVLRQRKGDKSMQRKVLIAIPSTGYMPAQTVSSLLELITPVLTKHCILIGALVYEARERIAKSAIEEGYTHILWLDSDVIVPRDALVKMLNVKAPIVSGVVFRRVAPYTPTVYMRQPNGTYREFLNIPDGGIIHIDACGFGCVLTETEALIHMYEQYGRLFAPEELGEDLQFCKRARDAGMDIRVDASIRCGHLGQIVIEDKHFKTARDALYKIMGEG